ncbi:uncharacterized protein LOC112568347 isoform X2 [Pomacea canaliculata]|uniref:uncharacterized protein LOC112568347 isoform X2 n=1 Tax=Pomacea canaliculata TaxID=400727 RepID=UPI000D73E60F|nr:uncharacterized protein LOC112568347 isoform X2 [Pomacea canaliculata]
MKTTHRLMAAFYLCGLLFLYHIDSVNSLRCKVCSYTDPNCNSGNVAERECQPNHTCAIIREFSTTRATVLQCVAAQRKQKVPSA